jgi:putative ABC transport system permease protein
MRTLYVSLKLAWRTLMQNKVRSVLTLLGMIIGVGAVIAIVSLGEGLRADFENQMSSLGADVFYMTPKAPKRPGQAPGMPKLFNMADMDAIRQSSTLVRRVVPGIMASATIKHGSKSKDVSVSGEDELYLTVSSTAKLDQGRFFTKAEVNAAARVLVGGEEIMQDLFEDYENPVGSDVMLNGVKYRIIGTLKHYSGMVQEGGDINNSVVAPITTVQKRLIGSDDIFWVSMYLKPGADLTAAKEEVARVMRQRRRVRNVSDDDFQFISPDDFKAMGNQFINTLIAVFGSIAFMSLLVGGVGIMNIMLVSVTERTREIGLRMAVGANRPTVLTQFLVEAIVLTLVGGLIGMGAGYGGAGLVSLFLTQALELTWKPAIPPEWVAYSVGVSVLIGVIFGTYPAWKASQLDPVEAMRYE